MNHLFAKSCYVPLIIFGLGFILFFNILFNGFIRDDHSEIEFNPVVQKISNIGLFFTESSFYAGETNKLIGIYYRPITTTYFSLIYTIFGANSGPFHFFQILFHSLNSILIYILLKKYTKPIIAFGLSLLFLAHPINQESVAFIANSNDILSFFFGILSLIISKSNNLNFKTISFISIIMLIALFSKETATVFLILIIGEQIFAYLSDKKRERLNLIGSLSFVFVFYILLHLLAVGFLNNSLSSAPIMGAPLHIRLLTMPKVFFYYLAILFFPNHLATAQSWIVTNINTQDFYLPLLIDVVFMSVLIIGGIFAWKKTKKLITFYLLFLTWFLLGLGLHSQIIPLDMTVADRYFYTPFAAILGMVGILLNTLKINRSFVKYAIISIFLIILTVLSIRTYIRNFDFKNDITLAQHDLRYNPDSFQLEGTLGGALLIANRDEEALPHIKRSIEIFPYPTNINNLGMYYVRAGQLDKANEEFRKAIKFGKWYLPYRNLSMNLVVQKKYQEAKDVAKEGLLYFPNDTQLWLSLAGAEYKLGNKFEAINAAKNSYATDPTNQDKYNLYYNLLNDKPIGL